MATASLKMMMNLVSGGERPAVRTITLVDLRESLAKGIEDFKANPSHLVMLFFIYPLVMFFAAMVVGGVNMVPLLFPLLAGFALIGPVAALGSYELSRNREKGLEVSLIQALAPLRSPAIVAILTLSVVLMVIYFAWLGTAFALHASLFGAGQPESIAKFAVEVVTTPAGWTMIVIGTGVGFLFAVAVLAIAAVSFPMLLDRNVGVLTAVRTSIDVVSANPFTMTAWGLIVVVALILGAIPVFVGLAVVMPVLGHSTWHLYRKVTGGGGR